MERTPNTNRERQRAGIPSCIRCGIMTRMDVQPRIEAALGRRVRDSRPLSGGCVGDVCLVTLDNGSRLVVKSGGPEVDVEARMLRYLGERTSLPVPSVVHDEPGFLAMEHVETGGRGDRSSVERHAAEALAALHAITDARGYGFEWDTVIGGLEQPNGWTAHWPDFYGETRILHMARLAHEAGRVDAALVQRVETLCGKLDGLIGETDGPALVHGDVWSGNVLVRGGEVAAFIDPAIYYGDREVELAFITMFNTFGDDFFERYNELLPIREGFFEHRRELYLLYPLLVHARLFGGGYVSSVQRVLDRYGV